MADKNPKSSHRNDEPRLAVRIEYVGVVAVVCFILGAVIGGYRPTTGANTQQPTQAQSQAGSQVLMGKAAAATTFDELVRIGNEAYDSQAIDAAIFAYEKALKIQPDNPDVLTDAGHMYLQAEQTDRAIAFFRRAAAADPKHAKSRFNLGIALMSGKRDYKGAAAAFRECLRVDPTGDTAAAAKSHLAIVEKMMREPPKP